MPGYHLGQTYTMHCTGKHFLARDGEDGLVKVVGFDNDNGSDCSVTEEWYQKHGCPREISLNELGFPELVSN